MSSSKPSTPRTDRRQVHGNRRHSHRSSGIHLPSLSPKVHHYPIDADNLPMDSTEIVEKFNDIAQSMEILDNNMNDLCHIHDNLSNQFNESFASFLYGLSMTMWCVDFPGCPNRVEWENLMAKREQKQRIKNLKKRVEDAKILNNILKESLAEKTKQKPTPSVTTINKPRPMNTRVVKPTRTVNFKPSSNESTISSITNDRRPVATRIRQSQQASRIPQPGRINRQHQYQTAASGVGGPNLNQPPRYMRGLFDGSNTSNTSNYGRVVKPSSQTKNKSTNSLANRPPFR
ncbi:DASH complex subunit DAM1 [Candida tropicalis]